MHHMGAPYWFIVAIVVMIKCNMAIEVLARFMNRST